MQPVHRRRRAPARAHRAGLAGASVFHGIEGFGRTQRIHTTRLLSLSQDLPVAVADKLRGAGIELAYRVAKENRVAAGVNRVLLCTDGDFNVGITSQSALVEPCV